MSYVSNRNLSNVVGRIDYISNPDRQENIVDFYNSQNNLFWKQLAKENREQFKITSHAKRNRRPVEAREFIIALPQNIDTRNLAKELCDDFYQRYGVYCACAIHYKSKNDNLHAHLIFSERETLSEPKIVEKRVAPRTYYYNAQGKKCKKADAVKVVPKGTVLQKGYTRYFDNKKDFYSMPFVKEYKNHIETELNLPKFDITRHFPTRHIGKNNPKSELFSEYNELISELNYYFDQVEMEYNLGGMTPKQKFCEMICENKLYIPQIDDIKEFMEKFKKEYPLFEKTAQNENKSLPDVSPEELIEEYREVKDDINCFFENYGSAGRELSTYSYWEQNGKSEWVYKKDFITNEYGFEQPRKKINSLIDKYSMTEYERIQPISNSNSMQEAYSIAQSVLNALKNILENIKEWFSKLTGKDIEPVVEEIENEERSKDEEELDFW